MDSATKRNKLNRDLIVWQKRRPFSWLTLAVGGVIGTLSSINQWPPCLTLGSVIALIFFGVAFLSTLTFFIIRMVKIKNIRAELRVLP